MSQTQAPAGAPSRPKPAAPSPAKDEDAGPKRPVGIRRVKMTISKVDPLSALKLGFLSSADSVTTPLSPFYLPHLF